VRPASGAIDRESERFGDEGRHALRVSVSVSFFEYEVAPDNVSQVSKSLTETGVAHIVPAGTDPNVIDSWHSRFLRAGSAGPPDHRSAEKGDKIAAFHSIFSQGVR
jgi:hypothetical protein